MNLKINNEMNAFSRRDLLAVVCVGALLAAMQFHLIAGKPGVNARIVACMANQRALAVAWSLYATENGGRIMPNNIDTSTTNTWCPGPFEPPDTGATYIKKGLIWPYIQDINVYKCPADLALTLVSGVPARKPRSYSMSNWMNSYAWGSGWHMFFAQQEIRQPDRTLLFLDENVDSINDGSFGIQMDGYPNPSSTTMIDFPAAYHESGDVLSFTDCHAEHWLWRDARTMPKPGQLPIGAMPNNKDILRMQSVATYKD